MHEMVAKFAKQVRASFGSGDVLGFLFVVYYSIS